MPSCIFAKALSLRYWYSKKYQGILWAQLIQDIRYAKAKSFFLRKHLYQQKTPGCFNAPDIR